MFYFRIENITSLALILLFFPPKLLEFVCRKFNFIRKRFKTTLEILSVVISVLHPFSTSLT